MQGFRKDTTYYRFTLLGAWLLPDSLQCIIWLLQAMLQTSLPSIGAMDLFTIYWNLFSITQAILHHFMKMIVQIVSTSSTSQLFNRMGSIKFYTGMIHSWITLTLSLWLSFRSSLRQSLQSRLKTEDQDWRLKNYVRPKSWYISPTTYKTYYISNTASKNGMKISNFSLLTFSSFIHNEYIYLNNYLASTSNP